MKKTYKLDELDCAHCGMKMEKAISKIDGVTFVNVDFMGQKITIEASDDVFDEVMDKAKKVCLKIEPDCKIVGA